MEVKDFQNKIIEFVSKWGEKRKTTPSEQETFNHLVEEIGELARQYVNQESRKEEYNEEEIKDAIGDILMQTIKLAHLRGLDIEETVLEIIEKEQKLLE